MPLPTLDQVHAFGTVVAAGASIDYAARVLALSPIAYYQLDGDATDSSGNGYDGTATGATFGTTGIGDGNTAAAFNGTSSRVDISAAVAAANPNLGTLMLWAQPTSWSDGTARCAAGMASTGNSDFTKLLKGATTNQVQAQRSGGGVGKTTSSTLSTAAWFHFALTWDVSGNAQKAYVNGAQIGTTLTGLAAYDEAVIALAIGDTAILTHQYWSGSLAHVAIFDRALSGAEVLSLGVL